MTLDDTRNDLEGLVIYVEETNRAYVPRQAVDLIRARARVSTAR
jgi:hypothetical protein